jgi:ribosomal protein S18 acetylase RimI-like enzyme
MPVRLFDHAQSSLTVAELPAIVPVSSRSGKIELVHKHERVQYNHGGRYQRKDLLMNPELLSFQYNSRFLLDAVAVYQTVWDRDPDDSLFFFRKHSRFPSFRGFVARLNGVVVGTVFGTASLPGHWWHDKVAEQVGAEHPSLQDAWVLTELAVLEAYRNQGIGGLLHDRVLRDLPLTYALLSTQADNLGARRFYEQRGWTYLHTGFAFHHGRPPYAIMQRRIQHED